MFFRITVYLAAILCLAGTKAQEVELGRPPSAPTAEELKKIAKPSAPVAEFSSGWTVNSQNREEVRKLYNGVYAASVINTPIWTGDTNTCNAGTTAAFFKEQVRLRVNFFRALVGVPSAILFDDTYSAADQQAALMMCVNNSLSHSPPPSWKCYTTNGADAAAHSNLAYGSLGPTSVDNYMEDVGSGNFDVGHRRWLIYPQTQFMGTGDTPFEAGVKVNGLWVIDSNYGTKRPTVRDGFVAWPSAGYVPYQLVPVRWSFTYPGANFSAATMTVTSNGVAVAMTKETVVDGYGENTMVAFMNGMSTSTHQNWPKPAADTTFTVNINGVTGTGVPSSFTYSVKVFDPATPGADTVVPTISGPDSVTVLLPSQFTFTTVPNATGYDLRARERAAKAIENGESGLGNFLTSTSGLYAAVITSPVAASTKGYRITHQGAFQQNITTAFPLFVRPGAVLSFFSKLGIATSGESAKVKISKDGGTTFTDLYSHSGNNQATPTDSDFALISLPLDAYVGSVVTIRFSYDTLGNFYNSSAANFGWFFDEITFTNMDELKNPVTFTADPAGSFLFLPLIAGGYALEVRPQLFGEFPLDWGPMKLITSVVDTAPRLQFSPAITVGASTLQFDFSLANLPGGTVVQLLKAPSVNGPWTVESGATFEVLSSSTQRVTISRPADGPVVYRLQGQ